MQHHENPAVRGESAGVRTVDLAPLSPSFDKENQWPHSRVGHGVASQKVCIVYSKWVFKINVALDSNARLGKVKRALSLLPQPWLLVALIRLFWVLALALVTFLRVIIRGR